MNHLGLHAFQEDHRAEYPAEEETEHRVETSTPPRAQVGRRQQGRPGVESQRSGDDVKAWKTAVLFHAGDDALGHFLAERELEEFAVREPADNQEPGRGNGRGRARAPSASATVAMRRSIRRKPKRPLPPRRSAPGRPALLSTSPARAAPRTSPRAAATRDGKAPRHRIARRRGTSRGWRRSWPTSPRRRQSVPSCTSTPRADPHARRAFVSREITRANTSPFPRWPSPTAHRTGCRPRREIQRASPSKSRSAFESAARR